MSQAADWVTYAVASATNNPAFTLTADQARCIEVISTIDTGPHNVRPVLGWEHVDFTHHGGVRIWLQRDLATFDGSELTRLVRAAHVRHVRVSISATSVPVALLVEEPECYFDAVQIADAHEWLKDPHSVEPQDIAWSPVLEVWLHARQQTGHSSERHPGLEVFQ